MFALYKIMYSSVQYYVAFCPFLCSFFDIYFNQSSYLLFYGYFSTLLCIVLYIYLYFYAHIFAFIDYAFSLCALLYIFLFTLVLFIVLFCTYYIYLRFSLTGYAVSVYIMYSFSHIMYNFAQVRKVKKNLPDFLSDKYFF